MTKVLSLRVPDDLAEWASAYAEKRGVTKQALLEEAVRSFREDCEGGVPDLVANAKHPGGELTDEAVAVAAKQVAKRPVPPPAAVPPVKRPARSSQSALAMARMRRMNPGRYG